MSEFAGRINTLPPHMRGRVLFAAYRAGRFRGRPDDLAAALEWTWQVSLAPTQHLAARKWVAMFRAAGPRWGRRAVPSLRPPAVLYRGATPAGARGMAWTTSLPMARHFADRLPRGRIVRLEALPDEAALAVFPEVFQEWVIDATTPLDIQTATEAELEEARATETPIEALLRRRDSLALLRGDMLRAAGRLGR